MKKISLKPIIMSALAAIAFGTVSVGTTFALFTDKAETKISVKAGVVDIENEIKDFVGYSMDPSDNAAEVVCTGGKFITGGTFALDDATKEITLEKVVPGDRIEFKASFKNKSNVAIKYRLSFKVSDDTGLASGLVFKKNGVAILPAADDWKSIDAGAPLQAEDQGEMLYSIELPKEAGNEYQDKSCKIVLACEAVQGNATVPFVKVSNSLYRIETREGLEEFATRVNAGESFINKTVELGSDMDLASSTLTTIGVDDAHHFQGTFEGNGHTIKNYTHDAGIETEKSLGGLFSTIGGATIQNLKLKNFVVSGFYAGALAATTGHAAYVNNVSVESATIKGHHYVGGLIGHGECVRVDGAVAKDVSVTATPYFYEASNKFDDGDKVGGLLGYIAAEPNGWVKNSSVENVTAKGYRDVGAILGCMTKSGAGTGEWSGNSVKGTINLTADQNTNSYGEKAVNLDGYDTNEKNGIGRIASQLATYTAADVSGATYTTTFVKSNKVDPAAAGEAIANATENSTVELATGTYEIPASTPKGVTIEGQKGTVISTNGEGNLASSALEDVTYKGIEFDAERNPGASSYGKSVVQLPSGSTTTFEDCEFTNGSWSTWDSAVSVRAESNVEFKNIRIDYQAFRGIFMASASNTNILIEDSYIDAIYPFNCDGGNGTILVKNSSLHGWTSYGSGWKVTFDHTVFSKAKSGYDNVAAYDDALFQNCEFDQAFEIYAQKPGFTFTVNDCTKNGVAVTADNFKSLFSDSDVWNKCTCIVNGVTVAQD